MRVLVLGGYGFIGREVVRRLRADGCAVVGLGRSAALGRRLAPEVDWIGADLARLTEPAAWAPHLAGVDAVVNASGALQDGAKDDLAAAQDQAIRALIAACETAGVTRLVQISAPGAAPDAGSRFMSTKGAADAALRASTLNWVIFKPGLVVGSNAYGGTSLLRLLAGVPWVQPIVLGDARIQTVAMSDVADAVARAVAGAIPMRRDYDLAESEAHALREVIGRFRAWLGFAPARMEIAAPLALGRPLARLGDLAGWLGWRAPVRTTALRVLADGVTGDPRAWEEATGRRLSSLEETLAALPAGLQERAFARAQLVFPILVLAFSGFWIASGVIGLVERRAAAAVLDGAIDASLANAVVIGGASLDILIGLGVLARAWTRRAALASIAVSAGYLVAGSLLTPHLWADPLGPFMKIVPAMVLGLAVAAMAEER